MRRAPTTVCAAVVFLGLFVVLPACSGQAGKTAPAGEAVAMVGGEVITHQELETFMARELAPLREQEFQLKTEGVKNLVFRRLLEREAAKAGVTPEEFHSTHVAAKAAQPSEQEIQETLNRYRSQLPRDDAEARARVVDFLRAQKVQEREGVLRAEWMDRYQVRILLEPPRIQVPQSVADLSKGPADAPVVIVEFSDYECPFCKRSQETMKQIKAAYGDKVRFVYKHFPLPMHRNARKAAEASLCAADQGKFWELHERLFAFQGDLNLEAVKALAAEAGVEMAILDACLESGLRARDVVADMGLGQSLGIGGTPAFFVNGRLLSGAQPFPAFKEIIDDELRRAASRSGSR